MKLHQIDPAIEKKLVKQLTEVRRQRNQQKVSESLDKLRKAAEDENANLMLPILASVKEYATLGEICGTLRDVFGEYRPPSIF